MSLKGFISSSLPRSLYLILMISVLGLCLLHPVTSQTAGIPASVAGKANANDTEEAPQIPEGLSPDEE